jgi:DNA-binding response OmpR family regulator
MNMRILIVSESESLKDEAKLILYQEGFDIDNAKDYESALHNINSNAPNLIFLDLDLYSSDSTEIYRMFRQNPKTKEISICFIANIDSISVQKSLALLSSEEYITKPLKPNDLIWRTKKLLKQSTANIIYIGQPEMESNSLNSALSKEGFLTTIIDDLRIGLDIAKNSTNSVILLNTESFSEDELQFFLQTNSQLESKIPAIFLLNTNAISANIFSSVINENDYLMKPYNTNDLLFRIKRQIAKISNKTLAQEQETKFDKNKLSPEMSDFIKKEKEAFIEQINVSINHEIRNPLTSIIIGSQALLNRFPEGSDEFQVIKGIEKSSQRIKEIIDALGNLKQFVVNDYVYDIKMINLTESAKS